MTEKKQYAPLTAEDNEIVTRVGNNVYRLLVNNELLNTDLIMNSLCCALTCLLIDKIDEDNRRGLIQGIYQILTRNSQCQ